MPREQLPTLPKHALNYLYRVAHIAIANKRYRWGIDILERYRRRFSFTNNQLYRLALLYDHLAMMNCARLTTARTTTYLDTAESLYHNILNRDPNYFLATYGIGRVLGVRGNHRGALRYKLRAYREMLKQPQKMRGALAIGVHYQAIGNLPAAEQWYLRELHAAPKNDFGANFNLMVFYANTKNYRKAFPYALIVEKLLPTELAKSVHNKTAFGDSSFIRHVRSRIKEVKTRATLSSTRAGSPHGTPRVQRARRHHS